MSQTLTKPILLDETGQAIKTALQNIDETESQDWLLGYEDVHSEMDDNVDRIATALEDIKDILESGEWYPRYLRVSYYPSWASVGDTFDITKLHVYVFMSKEVKESYIIGEDTRQIDITSQCEISHKNGDVWVPSNNVITATWTYGKTGITYTASQEITVNVPTFASGDWEGVLSAHYNPDIDFNLYDYWSVGDECSVYINGILEDGDTADKPRSSIQFVILNEGGKELVTPINGHTECAYIIGTKELVYNYANGTGILYQPHAVKQPYKEDAESGTYNGNWEDSTIRNYLNTTFKDASLYAGSAVLLNPLFKQFYNISAKAPISDETIKTADYFALASLKEIFGVTEISYGGGTAVSGEDSLQQFEYYKTATNRIKTIPNDEGAGDDVSDHIWLTRSTSYKIENDWKGVIWVWGKDESSDRSGEPMYSGARIPKAISPIMVI